MNKINEATATAYITTHAVTAEPVPSDSFSDVLADAIAQSPEEAAASDTSETTTQELVNQAVEDTLINTMLSSMSSTPSGTLGADTLSSGYGIESMLLSAASEGEISDTQLALFMVMMMMNSAGEGSDTSMLMSVMSALLSAMTDSSSSGYVDLEENADSDAAAGGSGQPLVYGWDYTAGQTKRIEPPAYSGSGNAVLPTQYWKPATPAVVGSENDRSAENYRKIIEQFSVESSARYQPRDGYTYCNIYVWDVTSALGAEIPHYVNAQTGEPMTYPDVTGAMELNSNRTLDWLTTKGVEYGWREVTAEEAQNMANEGHPAVGVWKNDGGIGHLQIVSPSEDGEYDANRGPAIAQAGRRLTSYTYQRNIYSAQGMSKVRYFVHD